MRLLLDTHTFLWWDSQPNKLSAKVLALCEDTQNEIFLSVASIWEMQIKHQLGKLELHLPLDKLVSEQVQNWLASTPGEQTIRIIFTQPQRLQQVWLHFIEYRNERTQEYLLRWSPDGGKSFREIVRQQWTFSPHGATTEIETHSVDLAAVTMLELTIIPDISGKPINASLQALRVA